MPFPIATAIIEGPGHFDQVTIRPSRAIGAVAGFHAPGWRAMAFRTIEAAKAKMERHPGFVRWEA